MSIARNAEKMATRYDDTLARKCKPEMENVVLKRKELVEAMQKRDEKIREVSEEPAMKERFGKVTKQMEKSHNLLDSTLRRLGPDEAEKELSGLLETAPIVMSSYISRKILKNAEPTILLLNNS